MGELVVFECDERRDHDGRSRAQQPREFVDGRLSRAGREHGQHVPAGGQGLDRWQLPRTEPGEAEAFPCEVLNRVTSHTFIIRARVRLLPGRSPGGVGTAGIGGTDKTRLARSADSPG